MSVFKRSDWHAIVSAINELAAGCGALPPLPEVPEGSKWRKSDIANAQALLTQICPENVFSPIPSLWRQSIVTELEAAIARGCCDCDEDRIHPGLNTFEPGGFKVFFAASSSPPSDVVTLDWAGWAFQQTVAPFDEEVPLATGGPLLVPSGGPGWVGREFNRWEVLIGRTGDAPEVIASGPVADGYLILGDEAAELAWETRGEALKQERDATVAKAQAQAAFDADPSDANEEALTAAEENLALKTAVRQAADSEAVNNPQTRHFPWRTEFSSPGQWELIGDGFSQVFPTAAFRVPGMLVAERDSPYLVETHPIGTVAGILRLFC